MKRIPAIIGLASILALVGCSDEPVRPEQATAPVLGAADGTDSADHDCNIVLRDLARVPGDGGGFENVCIEDQCWYVWEGNLDVATSALSEGAIPEVVYQSGSDNTWWSVGATNTTGAPTGYQRFSIRFFEHTVNPGVSLTSLMQTRIQVAPYLRTSTGGRLFDHNRNPGDFDNYLLVADNSWSIEDDSSVCGGTPVPVKLATAQVFTQFDYPNITHTTLKGTVAANAGTADESVTVHYRVSEGANVVRDWSTVSASRVSAGVWEFKTPQFDSACAHYCPRHVYQFAIAHTASGTTTWDNNGGAGVDYVLADDVGGSVPGYYGPAGILDTPVQLSYVNWQGGSVSGAVSGEILVENIAYHKDVHIVYSTDGWLTSHESAAYFSRTSSDNLEFWRFSMQFTTRPANLEFFVRYKVDGTIYLDTNLARYYRLPPAP